MNSTSPLAIPNCIEKANREFLEARRQLAPDILSGSGGLAVATELRELTDQWLRRVWQRALPESFRDSVTLFATGGYGRGELAYHSDIDVLLGVKTAGITDDPDFALAVERLMAWTRQPRLCVSHAVRTAEQVRTALQKDLRSAIALIDLRHLHGARDIDDAFQRRFVIDHLRGEDDGRSFVVELIESLRRRIARNGQTVYLLEPDVKNGEGGLRDLNCLSWATRVRWGVQIRKDTRDDIGWSSNEQRSYCADLDAILALRNHLHLLCDRKHDRLNFREQEALVRLRFDDTTVVESADEALEKLQTSLDHAEGANHEESPVELHQRIEAMMRDYYRRARSIAKRSERLLRRWATKQRSSQRREGPFELYSDRLDIAADIELTDPRVFDILDVAGRRDLLLDPQLETRLEHIAADWPAGDDIPREVAHRLRQLLVDPNQPARTSRRLVDLGILTRVVPEFTPLVCHVQHDLYHVYTTDVHSRKCLEEGRELLTTAPDEHRWPVFCRIGAEIEDRTSFLLACLFHDIGKNRGGNHSEKGADMIEDIGPRLGLVADQTRRLAFLVRHHLDLSTTSRRRDITDPEIIEQLARQIGSVDCLNQLTALTYCDMATVAPDVMNDWNASLLTELYGRLRAVLQQRPAFTPGPAARVVENRSVIRDELADAIADSPQLDDDRLDQFVSSLPVDHLRYTHAEAMLRQYNVYRRALESDNGVSVGSTPLEDRSVTEVIVTGPDRPGTLARLSGAIASVGLNIMTADVVTTDDGRALDRFFVAHFNPRAVPPARPRLVDEPHRIERLESRIADVLSDRIDIDAVLKRRRSEQRLSPRHVPAVQTSVETAPDASSRFTVIEVKTPDRLGLLYTIATALHDCRVNTRLSRIDSFGHQAVDTFYLEELDGTALSQQRTDDILDTLESRLQRNAD